MPPVIVYTLFYDSYLKSIIGIIMSKLSYLIVGIVFLAGNSPSSVKYTAYRKKSLGNRKKVTS